MPRSSVEADTSRLDRILRNLDGNVGEAIKKIGFSIEAKAKANVQRQGAIDTGAYINSYYTRTRDSNPFSQVNSEVHRRRPEAQTTDLPSPENGHTAYVGPTVSYALDIELGSARMGARPSLQPAVRAVEDAMAEALGVAITDG